MCGKGSTRQPMQISRKHEELQWALTYGHIGFEEYSRRLKLLKKQGKA